MVIDHMNTIWFGQQHFFMLLIGRGAFPLFCYAVAMAIFRAKPAALRPYIIRLGLLAVMAQPFLWYATGKPIGNVIFTLAAGALMAALTPAMERWQVYGVYILALLSMMLPAPVEFGLAGIMLPSALLLALQGRRSVYPFLILLLFFMNAADMGNALVHGVSSIAWVTIGLIGIASTLLPWIVLDAARALPPTGRLLPKYALHIFYPLHLLLLKVFSP